MIKDSTLRTLRTPIQGVLGLAASAPLLVSASGLPSEAAGVGVFVAVCAGVTHLMTLPVVNNLLPSWLRITIPPTPPAPAVSAAPSSTPPAGGGA